MKTKLLIIGSGPAGYTAAIYAARANLNPIIVQGNDAGGQLTITTDVENYPGFADVIQGPWLMEQMKAQAEHVGTKIIYDHITEVDFSKRPFVCKSQNGETFIADSVVIATGAQAKWLGIESEKKFQGYGVSGCATCDAPFYRNKEVFVIGGGNTAVEEALHLTHFASKVTIVHRRDKFRSEKILQDRLFKNPKIEVIWNHAVEEILGNSEGSGGPVGVTGLKIKNTETGEITTKTAHGVFIAIGHRPTTDLFKGQIDLDADGYIIVKTGTTQTNIKGVFAAGDVQDRTYRQAVTAAGTGCMAALEAEKFLAIEEFKAPNLATGTTVQSKSGQTGIGR